MPRKYLTSSWEGDLLRESGAEPRGRKKGEKDEAD